MTPVGEPGRREPERQEQGRRAARHAAPAERRPRARMNGMSIRARLGLLIGLITVLVLVGGSVALVGLRDTLARTEANTTIVSPALDANRDLHTAMSGAQAALRGYLVSTLSLRSGVKGGGGQATDFLSRYTNAESSYRGDLTSIDTLVGRAQSVTDDATADRLTSLRARQRKAAEDWWDYARQSRASFDVTPDLFARGDALFREFDSANSELSTALRRQRDALGDQMRDSIRATQRQVVVATLLSLLVATAVAWWTIRGLTLPLRRLRDTCLRQRAGSRTAWADEAHGSREVRQLAAGLNELTASHHELMDRQQYALDLAEARRSLSRRIQDAGDVESAFVMAVEGVAAALCAEQTVCLVSQVGGGDSGLCAVWSPDDGVVLDRVPPAAREELHGNVRELWLGERYVVVDDIAATDVPAVVPGERWSEDGAAIIVAFGTGEVPRGVMTVRTLGATHGWTTDETMFAQYIAQDLGRAVETAEVSRARQEHVERLEELDRQKDNFLSTVSHELRTPLTSMTGYLELLGDGDAGELTDEQKHMLGIIDRNASRLRSLIEDLLLINRMRDDASAGEERLDIDRLVREAGEEMAPVARARGVRLDVRSSLGESIQGNRAQLARVLGNVLSNAVKFTPNGAAVRMRTMHSDDHRTVLIICADEGMGIPAAEQDRLFTRFFRASNATRQEVPGTGLGLVVVKGIVEAHGGRLRITSTENVGTTVMIELPVEAEVREAEMSEPA